MSATGRATQRNAYDAYSTPKHCTEAICSQLVWSKDAWILEPCSGEGAISQILKRYAEDRVLELDIQRGYDFLEMDMSVYGRFDMVLTNPPFTLAQEFIEKSLTIANCVVMLLRLNFLASSKRKEFWQKHPPTAVHVLTRRPSFTGKGTDACDYAWFVWDSTGRQKVGWHWL